MSTMMLFFTIGITSSIFAVSKQLPPPYDTAKILPFVSHGWYANENQLKQLIVTHKVKTIIEVGCWLGRSTIHMASCLPSGGKLYAVDHWKGSVEHQEGDVSWGFELPQIYEYFLSNVIHAGLTERIIPVRMDSLSAAKKLRVIADLIYIDASHDTESVYADLLAWFPHLRPGGVFCGDDWSWDSVRAAVEALALKTGFRIEASGNFWRLIP